DVTGAGHLPDGDVARSAADDVLSSMLLVGDPSRDDQQDRSGRGCGGGVSERGGTGRCREEVGQGELGPFEDQLDSAAYAVDVVEPGLVGVGAPGRPLGDDG